MKPTILFFSFIVSFMYNVSNAQTLILDNSASNTCPLMEVNIKAANNNSGLYYISYCNHGNGDALNAFVEIELTEGFSIAQSTLPIVSQVGNKYRFDLGDVVSANCSAFYLEIPNVVNIKNCTRVQIYPNDPCDAMINHYIVNNVGNSTNTGNTTNITTITAMEGPRAAPIVGVGQTITSSIFEDHVFLNNIPSWDSLLLVLGNSNSTNPITNNGTTLSSTSGSISDKWNDNLNDDLSNLDITMAIAALSKSTYCHQITQNGTGTVSNTTTVLSQNASVDVKTTDPNAGTSTTVDEEIVNNTDKTNTTLSIKASPNPFDVNTTIHINGTTFQTIQIQIVDVSGRIVKVLEAQEQQQITIQRENLSQGVYFYQLIGDQELVHTGKLVVR